MLEQIEPMTAKRRAQIIPPAQQQADIPPEDLMNTANAAVVVQKVGQLRSEFRNEGRMFAREVARHVNTRQLGNATAFVYEETFGVEDRIHFLIHLRSFDTYYALQEMSSQDRAYRESMVQERVQTESGTGAWDRLFVDGSMRSNVLLPQSWGSNGLVPEEWGQQSQTNGEILHSGNAGIVLLRSARAGYGFRDEARHVARELTESINGAFSGKANAYLYDEAFGEAGRLHWLIALKDLTTYQSLIEQDVFRHDGSPRTFIEGSISEIALTPHSWGLYATSQKNEPA